VNHPGNMNVEQYSSSRWAVIQALEAKSQKPLCGRPHHKLMVCKSTKVKSKYLCAQCELNFFNWQKSSTNSDRTSKSPQSRNRYLHVLWPSKKKSNKLIHRGNFIATISNSFYLLIRTIMDKTTGKRIRHGRQIEIPLFCVALSHRNSLFRCPPLICGVASRGNCEKRLQMIVLLQKLVSNDECKDKR
jgi:hypothetical protein